ncbi:Oidioi.mRNA.OKI2018_I69.XSR.g16776.t1.cds [Oikopleura dioica]|uniref:Oidioi.mRNA.OKI2018_I69.XSR.g16776.t1.cds n=1 Tax=Oikopleura dioica TaxID=34765 RepID=A0ABN7SJ12_OIKDI|nr:Oidioi.mRNA.OKI2018_I69.XSR.g16776.t1.cds [Oikopleura dioica]
MPTPADNYGPQDMRGFICKGPTTESSLTSPRPSGRTPKKTKFLFSIKKKEKFVSEEEEHKGIEVEQPEAPIIRTFSSQSSE